MEREGRKGSERSRKERGLLGVREREVVVWGQYPYVNIVCRYASYQIHCI